MIGSDTFETERQPSQLKNGEQVPYPSSSPEL